MRGALMLMLTVTAAACGGAGVPPPSSPSSAGTPGGPGAGQSVGVSAPVAGQDVVACSLLSDAEIEDATGYPVLTKEPGPVMGIFENGCTWEVDSESTEFIAWSIELGVVSPGGRDYFDTFMGPDVGEPVTGIGDAAVVDDAGSITAVKGDTLVSVFVIGGDEAAITRDLVDVVLARIP